MTDKNIGKCTKCNRPTHYGLLDGKPAHPDERDFSLLECEECYGQAEYGVGDEKCILTFVPLYEVGSPQYEAAKEATRKARGG